MTRKTEHWDVIVVGAGNAAHAAAVSARESGAARVLMIETVSYTHLTLPTILLV